MSTEQINDGAEMTFGEHLDEIRKILVRVAVIFALLFVVLFSMKGIVLDVVFAPIRETFPTNRLFNWLATLMGSDTLRIHPDNVSLFNNKMAGQFLLHIKSSFVGAFVVAFPYLIWELWLFVRPALSVTQRRQSIRYVWETPIWFLMGLAFGYYIISPLAINFLGNYSVSDKIENIIDVSSFLTTVLSVSFAAALAFQLPLLIRLLASIGLVTSKGMRQYRKIAVVLLLIFAAIITPPDVVSQVLIFIPCYALYEYGIGIAARIEQKRAAEEAKYQAEQEAEDAQKEAQREAERQAKKAKMEEDEKRMREESAKRNAEARAQYEKEQAEKAAKEAAGAGAAAGAVSSAAYGAENSAEPTQAGEARKVTFAVVEESTEESDATDSTDENTQVEEVEDYDPPRAEEEFYEIKRDDEHKA